MPWNQPKGSEKDELEEESFHSMVCETDRIPIGKIILAGLEEEAQNRGAKQIILNSREPAIPFYRTAGYTIIGPAHTLYESIKHVRMVKRIES